MNRKFSVCTGVEGGEGEGEAGPVRNSTHRRLKLIVFSQVHEGNVKKKAKVENILCQRNFA
jgi:hypothetical protein